MRHTSYDGRDYFKETAEWDGRIRHVHARGALKVGGKKVRGPARGIERIDSGSIMAVLYNQGYKEDINIEPHSRVWLSEQVPDHTSWGQASIRFVVEEE